jgi:hypothetical protein
MPIDLSTPVVIPAVNIPEKSADKVWILNMSVQAEDPTQPVSVTFTVAPFISATGDVLREGQTQIVVNDVMAACASNPTLATALTAIYSAVEELCGQQGLYGLTTEEPNV